MLGYKERRCDLDFSLTSPDKNFDSKTQRGFFEKRNKDTLNMVAQNELGVIGTKDEFHKLVSELSRLLGPSSGLDSADVNVGELKDLMEGYVSREEECRLTLSLYLWNFDLILEHLRRIV